ncbi:hypothetical protein SBRCBS47491_009449 [Sporothrix bragantina]|uniref:Uncharacterized protein n=1 Tax=Sporothrix bragantina TaxID=671064 RepID=A0ABP0CVT4_9PEZI
MAGGTGGTNSAPRLAGLGADGLRNDLGLERGDTILIAGKNSLNYLQVEFSALWAGITAAFGSTAATVSDLVHFIDIVEPKAIFLRCRRRHGAYYGGRRPGSKVLQFPGDFIKNTSLSYSPPIDLTNTDAHTPPAVIYFSSGTSGLPKGAMLSHRNLIAYLLVARATDPNMTSANQRHIYGVFTAKLPLLTGGYVRLLRDYNLHEYIRVCVAVRATTLRMVPPTLVAMVKDPFIRQQDLTSVQMISCSGAVLAPDIIGELYKMLGNKAEIVQGYGMTEGSATILRRYSARRKQGSVAPGESGEILFSAATVFMGYKKNVTANKEIFIFGDEWIRSGDIVKGNQVTPAELENVLHAHPLVMEAGVCDKWDSVQETEVPVGYVNLKPCVTVADRAAVLKEVLEYVNGKVAKTKKLRGGLYYLETFPRNATGKLMRRSLPACLQATRAAKL